jgi:alanine racemase
MTKPPSESVQPPDHSLAHLTVRLGAVGANYRQVLRRAASASAAPVVKANGYSMGLGPIAHALANAGADSFFVARLEEGIEARALLPNARIFVFDGVAPGTAAALHSYRLTPVLNSLEEIAEWSARAKEERTDLDAALQIDTGINRSGLSHAELSQLASRIRESLVGINLVLILSHLACADEPGRDMNWVQLARFRAALAALPPAPASLAASAGIELGRDFHFDVVRPGLAIYGGNPVLTRPNPYHPVATLTGRVLQIRHIDEGETVGYGATFTAARPSRLAIVGSGYADGLIRASGLRGRAAIAGVRVPFAGRLSMDLLALDATDVPLAALERGTEVEFMGDVVALEEVAEAAGTITHEVLTSISPRARRIYLDE